MNKNTFTISILAAAIFFGPQKAMASAGEKILEHRSSDGVAIRVHYSGLALKTNGADTRFARQVMSAAAGAYELIAHSWGFSSPGYSIAHPDKHYAYDPDRTIDVFIGDPKSDTSFLSYGLPEQAFRDAPCFDTLKRGEQKFDAVILLPANYREFIKNWEKLNPSSAGPRNINIDLRGTLAHEMLHVILFYYNKNLSRGEEETYVNAKGHAKADWYVEGLARYFETMVGAKHDFFSQGFKQTLPGKVRFSRGGSNFFMRYPDQAFTGLRYENALFWKFIDDRYGMDAIERLSRELRRFDDAGVARSLEKATGSSFPQILKRFALAIALKDFGLKEDAPLLKDIATTRLVYRAGYFYLEDGVKDLKFLGKSCATDWIGKWGEFRARHGETPVAGDNTPEADVSGWATDFVEIRPEKGTNAPAALGIANRSAAAGLTVQAVLETRGGSLLVHEISEIPDGKKETLDLESIASSQGLRLSDIVKISLLVTNMDPLAGALYRIDAE